MNPEAIEQICITLSLLDIVANCEIYEESIRVQTVDGNEFYFTETTTLGELIEDLEL